ncbi:MAG: enoyl-CoA hydratase/isomerase family protein [Candidatus Dormibacteraeota bacterium]|nr:enoyl-CoA hydratase/isomerase family protein [Candidatus Dormibacteraeota bacterium]MBV9526674.1 enoyl-CoA hydratase/isomerase family protein [Candidatus Dormibacteraeota bacterium]
MTVQLEHALYEVRDAVATVTLNRPEQRNAVGPQMLRDLLAALREARDDDGVRAVMLTGAGDKAFSAGADLAGFAADATEVQRHHERGLFVELFLEMRHLGKPIVGAINGHALAGGFGLALACDLLVAADGAMFGTPEIRVGVWPMMIMSIVVRHIGPKRAMQLFLSGERIDAETAMQWGLVNRVVPAAEVRDNAFTWARDLTQWSPLVMQLGRDAFYDIDGLDLEAALRHLQSQLTVVSLSEDFREGVAAFLQKRPAQFKGR